MTEKNKTNSEKSAEEKVNKQLDRLEEAMKKMSEDAQK